MATRKSQRTKTQLAPAATVNYIPNDPLALSDAPVRVIEPHLAQTGEVARFTFIAAAPRAGRYQPGTAEFLFWQTREAALGALDTLAWCDKPIAHWAEQVGGALELLPDAGHQLNAYYNRRSVSFFSAAGDNGTTFSGASADVVAHEVGHAILDSLRPDLWNSAFPEHGAFHESFGDCVALLSALRDHGIRADLLRANGSVDNPNFVEATAEDLCDAVRRTFGPDHPAAKPRHALNKFVWKLPTLLPTVGGPDVLTGEVHSFARVFTGCFYDTVRNIFSAQRSKTSGTLGDAARTAGHLLVGGVQRATGRPRFFEEVGTAMLLVDAKLNNGENSNAITNAFRAHGITLVVPASSKRNPLAPGDDEAEILVHSLVSLDGLSPDLDGVFAQSAEYVSDRGIAPEAVTTDEVRFFVETLLDNGSLAGESVPTSRMIAGEPDSSRVPSELVYSATHAIQVVDNVQLLRRIGFV